MRRFGATSLPATSARADEVVPLRERVAYLEALRGALAAAVLAILALDLVPNADATTIVGVTLAYLAVSLLPLALRGADPSRLLPVTRGMLLVDGIYLAWVVLQTGGPFSPARILLFVHVIVVTLLVSYRTGLKLTAWQTLLFLLVVEAWNRGLGATVPELVPEGAMLSATLTVAALWAIAFSTAMFSAINERALRRQNAQLARLAAMTRELDEAEGANAIPPIVLSALQEAFGCTRSVMIASPHDDLRVLAGAGMEDVEVAGGLDPIMERAWIRREPTLVRGVDAGTDPRLGALLPAARNVMLVPLFLPRGYRLGLIVTEHARARGRLPRWEVLMIERYASHAALALHNAWLMEERERRLDEITTLQREVVAHNARLELAVAERTDQLRATIAELEEIDAQRRRLLQGLVHAQEDERTRLANDIHDDPLQKLVALKMLVELLQRHGTDGASLDEIHETLRSCITSLRFMLFDLRPPILDERGLAPALERFLEQSGMGTTSSVSDEVPGEIDPQTRVILYRIAQEALTNVKKHAEAGHVAVRLQARDGGVLMRISDDGRGFRPEDVAEAKPGHLGLGSMRERAAMAGGRSELFSLPGAGTTLEIWLPPPPSEEAMDGASSSQVVQLPVERPA